MTTSPNSRETDLNRETDEIKIYNTRIQVMGIGGAGNNTINRLSNDNIKGIETIAVNTDAQDLTAVSCDRRILIGHTITSGLGSGGDPQIGEHSALESRDTIKAMIADTDLLIMTCGMGGGTGTGAIPVIGHLARDMGILTVAVVTMPFSEEGLIRWENALIGLDKIRRKVDTLIVLRNDKLADLYTDMSLEDAFREGDRILHNIVVSMTSLILETGIINLDFADISMVLRDGPNTVIGIGESDSENRVEEAVHRAVSHPMMDQDIRGAQSAIVHVSGGTGLKLGEARTIISKLAGMLDPHARIIWGVDIKKNFRQQLKVIIIASGLHDPSPLQRNQIAHAAGALFTETGAGEDGAAVRNSIFDIKDSIMATGTEITAPKKSRTYQDKISPVFYKILKEEAAGDLKKFDRALHVLRQDAENRKALIDAKQACKLLLASAQMFGFDEIKALLEAIDEILTAVQARELKISKVVLDSVTLAMEMVIDLIENQSDGRGETGYIADRLRELKEETV